MDRINGSDSATHCSRSDTSGFHGFKYIHVDLLGFNSKAEQDRQNQEVDFFHLISWFFYDSN